MRLSRMWAMPSPETFTIEPADESVPVAAQAQMMASVLTIGLF